MKEFTIFTKEDSSTGEVKTEAVCIRAWNGWAFVFTYGWALFQGLYLVAWVDFLILGFLGYFAAAISAPDINTIAVVSIALINRCVFSYYGNYWKTQKIIQRGYTKAGVITADSDSIARATFTGENNITPSTSPS